jgi:hypothetical protein
VTDESVQEHAEIKGSVVTLAREGTNSWSCRVDSLARDSPRMESDIDLVGLTLDQESSITTKDWIGRALQPDNEIVRTQGRGGLPSVGPESVRTQG